MRFAKLHGLGNDFVLVDRRRDAASQPLDAERSAALCDRNRGVGADGVLTLLHSGTAGARLVVINSDGSRPEMCGNGARVAALWMATEGCTRPAEATVLLETDAGPRPCRVWAATSSFGEVEVGMGPATFGEARELPLGNRRVRAQPVSMGNPHRVIFLDAPRGELLRLATELGPVLQRAENANIEFVARAGPQRFTAVVYERGAGLTQACGTGACAVAAAALLRGDASFDEPVLVELPGGPLTLTVAKDFSEVRMRGPAQLVFSGELPEGK